ncbi:MAG: inositol monophosphatase family protein [Pseudomonadota bacterium]
MDKIDPVAIQAAAWAAANAALAKTLAPFRTQLAVDNKEFGSFDPVTEADRAAELAMRETLSKLRPEDGILGEEFAPRSGRSGLTWVLDPIDGTRAYICGTPTWGTLIAASTRDGPIAGIIDQPHIGERFWGGFGEAFLERGETRSPLKTSDRKLQDARLFTTFPEVGTKEDRMGFEAVACLARLTRYGLDCYAYALVALGQADLVIEAGLQPYDIQAPIAVIEAAGGIVTNWRGGPAHHGGQVLAAANEPLHAEALELLTPFAM